jgi:hypothetical protein
MKRPKLALVPLVLAALLAAGACSDLDSPAAQDEVLQVTVSPRALPADGFSSAEVVAEIDPRSQERYRDITFSTSLGSFPAGTSTGARTIVAAADSNGRALVVLRSAAQPGTATVTAEVRDGDVVKVARSAEVPFEPVAVSSVVVLDLGSAEAPADGATVTNAVARIATAVPSEQRTVTFATTAGTLGAAGGTSAQVRAGTDDLAIIGVVSPRTVASAVVTASVNNLTARKTIEFTHAYPDRVSVGLSGSFRLTASFSTKALVRVELTRETGTVTRGTEVRFAATDDSTGNEFGFWSAVTTSDTSGNASAEFTPGNTAERGEATIRATVPGTGRSAAVKIEIVP